MHYQHQSSWPTGHRSLVLMPRVNLLQFLHRQFVFSLIWLQIPLFNLELGHFILPTSGLHHILEMQCLKVYQQSFRERQGRAREERLYYVPLDSQRGTRRYRFFRPVLFYRLGGRIYAYREGYRMIRRELRMAGPFLAR